MINYIPGGLESVLKNKNNIAVVEEIDKEFFSSDVLSGDHGERLQRELEILVSAGEKEFVDNIHDYLKMPG